MSDEPSATYSRRRAIQTLGTIGVVGLAGCAGGDGGDGSDGSDGSDGGSDGGGGDGGGSTGESGSDGGGGGNGGDGDGGDGESGSEDTLRAAWVTDTPVGDLGWSFAHDQGRQAAEEQLDGVETTIQTEVAPEDSERVMNQLSSDGYDVIFGCAFGYMDAMASLSEEYPDIAYEHATGVNRDAGMGIYFGRQYQNRYLLGQAAGLMDGIDTVGYVAAFPLPEVIRGINAFALGARSVDADPTITVRWTNTWFDPPTETDAAQSLIDEGADMMAQHQDSPAALNTAADAGIWASGYQAPMKELAGENYLTSPIWNWGAFYVPAIREVRSGDWSADFYWGGLNEGVVALDEFGSEVPSSVVEEVEATRESIQSGDLDVWSGTEFADREDWWLYSSMEEFVPRIDGEIPE
jgi:basic membrane protein A